MHRAFGIDIVVPLFYQGIAGNKKKHKSLKIQLKLLPMFSWAFVYAEDTVSEKAGKSRGMPLKREHHPTKFRPNKKTILL